MRTSPSISTHSLRAEASEEVSPLLSIRLSRQGGRRDWGLRDRGPRDRGLRDRGLRDWGQRDRGLRVARLLSVLLLVAAFAAAVPLEAQTLRGGQASLDRQNDQARLHDFSYLGTAAEVNRFVELGYLVPLLPGENLELHQVSFPYARPEVRLFLERLSEQYRAACGEVLVVTSLTRPSTHQPRNASSRSVHPTGMAVDLRRSNNPTCRGWLESTLLTLESRGVLEAIQERNPPHYHLALFPDPYIQYVARITGNDRIAIDLESDAGMQLEWVNHTVRRGESLTLIANRYGTAIARIQAENGIRGSRIQAGQVLRVPVYGTTTRVASTAEPSASNGSAGMGAGDSGVADGASAGSSTVEGSTEAPDGPSRTRNVSLPATAPESENAPQGPSDSAPGPTAGTSSADGVSTAPSRGHTVTRGESIWSIARRYGISELALRRANGLASARIVVGQELRIPSDASLGDGGAVTPEALDHEVRTGESLWAIARLYGVTIGDIQEANGLASGSIHPGQRLVIPSGT